MAVYFTEGIIANVLTICQRKDFFAVSKPQRVHSRQCIELSVTKLVAVPAVATCIYAIEFLIAEVEVHTVKMLISAIQSLADNSLSGLILIV